jgi:hypothetical protein
VNILLETLPLPIERLALPVLSLVEGSTVKGLWKRYLIS